MTDPKSPMSSFGEELHKALRLGCKQEVTLTFAEERLAIRFRQRIMALRRAMRAEKHPDWQEAYRCGIFHTKGELKVTLRPRDSEFKDVLAGLETPPPPPIAAPQDTDGAVVEDSAPVDPAEALLRDLRS